MDTDALDHLPLIEEGDTSGYALEDIERALGPALAAEFGQWFHGQTGAILQDRICVYPWDLARFIRRERRHG